MASRKAGAWAGATGLMALPLAIAMALMVMMLQSVPNREVSLSARVPRSEHKMVNAAEHATESFADHDVTTAVLRAQQAAKARYQKMMAAALQAEARAHKEGEVATAKAMSYQQSLEKRMLFARRKRDMMDEARQIQKDQYLESRMNQELSRTLGGRVIAGQ